MTDWFALRTIVVNSARPEPYPGHKIRTLILIDEEIAIVERETKQAELAATCLEFARLSGDAPLACPLLWFLWLAAAP